MEHLKAKDNIYFKLFKLQQKIKPIKKDSVNSHFKNTYFDINSLVEALKPHLDELHLVILQPLSMVGEKQILETIVLDTDSGEQVSSHALLPEGVEPQKMGSAITYYRRYSLQSLLFLEAEDDDANSSSPKNNGYAPRPVTPKKPISNELEF